MTFIIQGVYCEKCKEFIYSRSNHDYRKCTCGETFIDGGLYIKDSNENPYYCRTNVQNFQERKISTRLKCIVDENSFRELLYEDYLTNKNKFGKIQDVEDL